MLFVAKMDYIFLYGHNIFLKTYFIKLGFHFFDTILSANVIE